MKNSKFFQRFMALFLTFITVLSFSSQAFAMDITPEKAREIRQKLQEAGPLELAVTDMCLAVGDFIMEYLTFLLKDEVTVQKIIYNQVDALNANFFVNSVNSSEAPTSEIIREMVNTWYDFLGKLVIIIYMIALIVVGLRTLLGGVGAKAQAQELLVKWTMGIAIFFFFPYLMRYSFDLNEALLRTMQGLYGGSTLTHCLPFVTPGRFPAFALSERVNLFINEDFPTLGIPTTIVFILNLRPFCLILSILSLRTSFIAS